jgi:hypothetical protein
MTNMKKIKIYAITCLAAVSQTSCNEWLNLEPYNSYPEDIILRTPEGINSLLNGIYDGFQSTYYYGRFMYAYEAAKGADFFVRIGSGGRFETENQYAANTSAGVNTWSKIYATIRTANILLENIDHAASSDTLLLRTIKGEATALRALAYFDLMRIFAYPPVFSIPDEVSITDLSTASKYDDKFRWGVPIITTVEAGTNIFRYTVVRQTADSSYRFIENEYLKAEALLAGTAPRDGHINHVAVCALLARMYLYKANWNRAVHWGEKALEAANGRYSMISYDNYKTTYYKTFNQESIFELGYGVSDNLGSDALNYVIRRPTVDSPGAPNDGKVAQNLGYSAFGLFPNNTVPKLLQKVGGVDDVRGYLVCELGIEGHPDWRTLRKYKGDPYHYVHNIPIVRLPEIYLTLAEAYAENDDMIHALHYYNQTRTARVKATTFNTGSKSDRIAEILLERRLELMLEGHTFWDYFRRAKTMTRERIERATPTSVTFGNAGSQTCTVVYNIPLDEMEVNAPIRNQKNPGYSDYAYDN